MAFLVDSFRPCFVPVDWCCHKETEDTLYVKSLFRFFENEITFPIFCHFDWTVVGCNVATSFAVRLQIFVTERIALDFLSGFPYGGWFWFWFWFWIWFFSRR